MLGEIRLYGGNFGDPIVDTVDFDATKILESKPSEEKVLIGAGIALLVEFCSGIDNSTYEAALGTKEHRALSSAQANGWFVDHPVIEKALRAASISEEEFLSSLKDVYVTYVDVAPDKT